MIIFIFKFLVETFCPPFWYGKTPTCDVVLFTALNWPFPSCVKPLFQGETKCEIIDMTMQSNLYIPVTLGKWQCNVKIIYRVTANIQVNFAENMGRLSFGKLSGDRNIPGDRYIQGRYIQVGLLFIHRQISHFHVFEARRWPISFVLLRFRWAVLATVIGRFVAS